MNQKPRGVIAAIATPVSNGYEPDLDRFVSLARFLLANGCDGLNVLGTTGEATSFSVEQRIRVMECVAGADFPMHRLLVGTGASALADAMTLTRKAASLGFGGALLLPPFYYKNLEADGVRRYLGALIEATSDSGIPIYLYNFPALSGVKYELDLMGELLERFGVRLGGLKDSSGDLSYALEATKLAAHFDVFPSSEATLADARDGPYAGCISATANVNASYCSRALHDKDDAALATAVNIRRLFDGKPLVAGVKALLSRIHDDAALARTMPPLSDWSAEMTEAVFAKYGELTSSS